MMEHNPISMGDVAMSAVDGERSERRRLEQRVADLEEELSRVYEWSEVMADSLNALAEYVGFPGK